MRREIIAIHRPEVRTIVGWPDDVAAVLRSAERESRLLTDPAEIARSFDRLPDGRVSARVRLMVRQAPPVPDRRQLRRGAGLTLVILTLAAGAFYALARVLIALVSHATLIAAASALVILLWASLSVRRKHVCRGLHCPDCPRSR